jgi:hypothetical protein
MVQARPKNGRQQVAQTSAGEDVTWKEEYRELDGWKESRMQWQRSKRTVTVAEKNDEWEFEDVTHAHTHRVHAGGTKYSSCFSSPPPLPF